jgi:hypothetical protein
MLTVVVGLFLITTLFVLVCVALRRVVAALVVGTSSIYVHS